MVLLSFMHSTRALLEFLPHAQALLQVLRHESHELSDIDLHMLTTQLHLLEIEATNLQTFRQLQLTDRAA